MSGQGLREMFPPVRVDSLPEGITYRDTGCRAHATCLDCPFPECLLMEPRRAQLLQRAATRELAMSLRAQGFAVKEIAARLGVSRRCAGRYLGWRDAPSRKKKGGGRTEVLSAEC